MHSKWRNCTHVWDPSTYQVGMIIGVSAPTPPKNRREKKRKENLVKTDTITAHASAHSKKLSFLLNGIMNFSKEAKAKAEQLKLRRWISKVFVGEGIHIFMCLKKWEYNFNPNSDMGLLIWFIQFVASTESLPLEYLFLCIFY